MIRRLLPAFAAVLVSFAAIGAPAEPAVRPFVTGSLARIAVERQGRPFILALWSLGCTHCPSELRTLAALKRRHPQLDVVLVSTDAPEDAARVAELAASFGLGSVEQWVFADPSPERLRYEIDRRWYGELPRTQFYDRQHKVEGVSGVVPAARFEQWLRGEKP